jgi:quinol monooxygenase YgiN
MYISFTGSKASKESQAEVEKFLSEFLPKMRKLPGVVAIYHYSRPEFGDDSTVVVWKDREALQAYRSGELIKEAIVFEKAHGLHLTREAYPLTLSL